MTTTTIDQITGAEADLARLFGARSIAIVGASGRQGALNWWPLQILLRYGFTGSIHPVNPRYEELGGLRCYATIADVPEPIDIAVVTLNAGDVPRVVRECVDVGVGTIVIPAQGLGESGPDGKMAERELVDYARARGVRLAGPNTDGVGCIASGALATIQPLFDRHFRPGPIGVVTQSGATAGSLLSRLHAEGLGCSLYASTGNEADLGIEDYISYMVQDPQIRIVLAFVESIRRPELFRKAAERARELGKPIALIKVGRSEEGANRAAAHTGALAGADALYQSFFQSLGVIRVDELAELTAVAKLYLACGRPTANGVGILSVSGGQAGAMADLAVAVGLNVPQIAGSRRAALDAVLRFGNAHNPCDLTGEVAKDPTLAAQIYAGFSEASDIGLVVYGRKFLTGTAGIDAARNLVAELDGAARAPLAIYAMDGVVDAPESDLYRDAGVPVFGSLHELFGACRALGLAVPDRPQSDQIVDDVAPRSARIAPESLRSSQGNADLRLRGVLDESSSRQVLADAGLRFPAEIIVGSVDDALAAARSIGFPVVLKIVSERIAHKSDVGGVVLDLADEFSLRAEYDRMARSISQQFPDIAPLRFSVQEQLPHGLEVIVGAKVDDQLGPFVLVGLGGVLAELLDDVVLRPAPVDVDQARSMVRELRGAPLFDGYRGTGALDTGALAEVVSNLSHFVADHADVVREVDLNPVLVYPAGSGVCAADALVVCVDTEETRP